LATLGIPQSAKADLDPSNLNYNLYQPNILIIMVDQLRYKELADQSPNLSSVLPNITTLQSQSVEFTNYFVAGTTCTPSRASIMTGLYPPQTCMYITQGNGAAPSLAPTLDSNNQYVVGLPTWSNYLKSKGYNTLYFGKWHLSDESPNFNDEPMSQYGFTYAGTENPSPDGFPNEGVTGGSFTPPHEEQGTWINDLQIVQSFQSAMPTYTASSTPWCAVVSLINPHDISNYPAYLPNFCQITPGNNPIQPDWAPKKPGVSTWPQAPSVTYPPLPSLFNAAGATFGSGGAYCVSSGGGQYPFSEWYLEPVSGAAAVPSNATDNDLTVKPSFQTTYQNDTIATFGGVGQIGTNPNSPYSGQNFTANNGDWGNFLNTYYWLAACSDSLIGNLAHADLPNAVFPTILGQIALLLTPTQLSNTVIIFTSDHGELGGAHTLQGKSGCAYDEAINVPFFVYLPAVATNVKRTTQMVSSVDLFGLLAAMATYNPNHPNLTLPWRTDNPQLANRESLFGMLLQNTPNAYRVLSSTDSNVNGLPFVMHTCNEFYANKNNPMPYGATELCHVVTLRTINDKLVYYLAWGDGQTYTESSNYPSTFNTSNTEYYNFTGVPSTFTAHPQETGNQFVTTSSYIADLQTAFQTEIANELQAALPTNYTYGANGTLNLQTVLATAQSNYLNYVAPPTNVSVSPSTATAGQTISFSVTAENVQPGPTLTAYLGNLGNGISHVTQVGVPVIVPESGTGSSQPFTISVGPLQAGTYSIQLSNPSSSYGYATITVSE
jgi:uncharacterized sulfatase